MIRITKDFIGGNIAVVDSMDHDVFLENELRDSDGDWFYWAFCIENAQGKELTFHLQKSRLGYWGPAVSIFCSSHFISVRKIFCSYTATRSGNKHALHDEKGEVGPLSCIWRG